jgi:large subunit ribosomal protein L3
MREGILGKKLGMTQIFDKDGKVIPATVIGVGSCAVIQQKSKDVDGYEAIQLGFDIIRENKFSKSQLGHFKKSNTKPTRFIREIRGGFAYKPGDEIKVDIFKEGEYVDVTGISKGKGFAGGMKRWGWSGGGASHGSMSHRRIGAVGAGTSPGRVLKGKTMPGRMGFERVTVQNLKVVKVDGKSELLLVEGAVPGIKGGCILIRKALKKCEQKK